MFNLVKSKTFLHTCTVYQYLENGGRAEGKLKVRFKRTTREEWDAMSKPEAENAEPQSESQKTRLAYDDLVVAIETPIANPSGEGALSAEDALAAVREDLALTGQIVDQGLEVLFGQDAKNARLSRGR